MDTLEYYFSRQQRELAVTVKQNPQQLHLFLASGRRVFQGWALFIYLFILFFFYKRGGMFPVKPDRSAALSLQRDCLQASDARASSALVYFQLQFLCAQHHLECGHQRARSSRKHMAHEQEKQRSSTPLLLLSPAQNNIALSRYAHTNKHTHPPSSKPPPKLRDADHRAGDTAGAVKSA